MLASSSGSRHRGAAIRVVPEGDAIALCLEGEWDLTNARGLRDQIDRALESGKGLILDLSDATYIDSSVIHVLVRTSRAAGARRQPVILQLGTATIVERAIEVACLDEVLPRAHDREEAVRIIRTQESLL